MTKSNCVVCRRETKQADNGLLCRSHDAWLRHVVADIFDAYALLPHFFEPGTAVDDGRQVKGTRIDPPAPIRLDVVALLDRRTKRLHPGDPVPVLGIVETWAELVCEERGIQRKPGPVYLSGVLGVLERHHDWIVQQAWVDEYARELRECRAALNSAIGDHAPRSVGRCPVLSSDDTECNGPLHQDRYGRLSVTCARCGAIWGEDDLRRLGLVLGA